MVEHANGELKPFERDLLFISIFESCKHRETALQDARSLTQLAIDTLIKKQLQPGVLKKEHIVATVHAVLKRFDKAAATFYAAYHSSKG